MLCGFISCGLKVKASLNPQEISFFSFNSFFPIYVDVVQDTSETLRKCGFKRNLGIVQFNVFLFVC